MSTWTPNRAVVVHLTPQRIRIKIPGWERQEAHFSALRRVLEKRPDVVSVRVNALVASVVIHCRDGFEIASLRGCFRGLELVLPDSGAATNPRARQIAPTQRSHDRSTHSIFLISFVVKLAVAIATRRFEVLIRELILEAALQVVVPQLYRKPMQPARLEAPRAPLLATAG